ncbi:putative ABC transport system permease protein [Actinacidiphila yanglinensis]|uniref:Putative ABC transport system permease protein n=1 Tax=Actinacidiphila yanglinensis TaxID=310779 RepID=A0A1H5TJE0_9ACTN|nr:ABC transporter permease [Actinacidiphila yanglinensis]SEF62211.1 putative ABC transport system permease protein [Actinacidiphila yanglinensis]
MSALGRVVRAGVARRRVQTLVMVLTTMLSVTASIAAGGLIVASTDPFDHAFARQHGAHLAARFDGREASPGQIAATAHAASVTAAAGPFAVASASPRFEAPAGLPAGTGPALDIAGRADAGGPADRLELVTGHWLTGPGQIVLAAGDGDEAGPDALIGTRLSFPGLPGTPRLTVVGEARSVGRTADAWVVPAQIAALTPAGGTPSYEMLYRFAHAGSSAQISRDRAAVAAAVPAGSMSGAQSYLTVRAEVNRQTATFVPFILAFGVLGLVLSVLIIGIVVSGAVTAGTRRIGVLKALGLTPAQVGRAYVAQAVVPAAAGALLGVALGNLVSVPLLHQADTAYGAVSPVVAWWIDLLVPAGMLVLVVASALAPALRAAGLRTVQALAVGRTPRAGRGRTAARVAGRLPVPRAVGLGLAGPFARPARSATTWAAVALGAAGVTFAFGLATSLNRVQDGLNQNTPGQVQVTTLRRPDGGAPPNPPATAGSSATGSAAPGSGTATAGTATGNGHPGQADPAAVGRAIAAQPGTRAYFGTSFDQAHFAGVAGAVQLVAYQGDSSWGTYQMVGGHWFTGPGQAVVGHGFLTAAGARVGDTVTLVGDGRSTRVRIVGEALITGDDGKRVLTDARTLTAAGLRASPDTFSVELADGTDRATYLKTLDAALEPLGAQAGATVGGLSSTVVAIDAMAGSLTLLLIVVTGLGVLTTVVLDTRERVHDLGVLKALGMAPRQTAVMVVTSAGWIGAVAGLVGVPAGMALHARVLPVMAGAAGTRIPRADLAVYHAPQIACLALAGLLVATAGALLPATWAARTRTATALRTE